MAKKLEASVDCFAGRDPAGSGPAGKDHGGYFASRNLLGREAVAGAVAGGGGGKVERGGGRGSDVLLAGTLTETAEAVGEGVRAADVAERVEVAEAAEAAEVAEAAG